jgi:uncharacterized membrane protein
LNCERLAEESRKKKAERRKQKEEREFVEIKTARTTKSVFTTRIFKRGHAATETHLRRHVPEQL